jgi:topoisomerase-4 subunit B
MENDNVVKRGNGVFIKGLVNDRIETVYVDDRFKDECSILLPAVELAMSQEHMLFLVNGKKMGLYELVSDAMNSIGAVNRFKGLGEMNPSQLQISTMSPETRTLIQYTINDLNETVKIIRQYDSNKKLILNKIGLVDRGDLVGL